MKLRRHLIIAVILIFHSFLNVNSQDQWVVVFADEFDGNSLDREQWNVMPFGAHTLYCNELKNVEHQYYSDEYNNLEVSNGTLKLIARRHDPAILKLIREDMEPDAMLVCDEGEIQNLRSFSYSSGMIESKRNFSNGRYEIICKMPWVEDNHLFPAFWLYGDCKQEVDIFEFRDSKVHGPFNKKNNSDFHPFYTVWKSKHCDGDRKKFQEIDDVGFPITQVWAKYSLLWDENALGIFINDDARFSFINFCGWIPPQLLGGYYFDWCEYYPTYPMSIFVNLGIEPNSNANFPMQMEIESIRVLQKVPENTESRISSWNSIKGSTVTGQNILVGPLGSPWFTVNNGDFLTIVGTESITLNSGVEIKAGGIFEANVQEPISN